MSGKKYATCYCSSCRFCTIIIFSVAFNIITFNFGNILSLQTFNLEKEGFYAKKLFSILALVLTAVLVVGCNTSDKTGDSDAQQNEPSNTGVDQKPSGDETAGESQEEEETPASDDTNTEDTSKQPQQDVKYVQKAKIKRKQPLSLKVSIKPTSYNSFQDLQ